MSSTKSDFERLPKIYVPNIYTLELYPNAKDFSFQGKVTINMTLLESTKSIVLNAKRIEIIDAKVATKSFNSEFVGTVTFF